MDKFLAKRPRLESEGIDDNFVDDDGVHDIPNTSSRSEALNTGKTAKVRRQYSENYLSGVGTRTVLYQIALFVVTNYPTKPWFQAS